jgi:hypothetical protein
MTAVVMTPVSIMRNLFNLRHSQTKTRAVAAILAARAS